MISDIQMQNKNIAQLEHLFRNYIKQHRALLRWGVDKVCKSNNSIESLFVKTRHLIDKKETEDASTHLKALKCQLDDIQQNYPEKKSNLEAELKKNIVKQEADIQDLDASNDEALPSKQKMLFELEIARVAMQNEDWVEAKKRMAAVSQLYSKFKAEFDEKIDEQFFSPDSINTSQKAIATVIQSNQSPTKDSEIDDAIKKVDKNTTDSAITSISSTTKPSSFTSAPVSVPTASSSEIIEIKKAIEQLTSKPAHGKTAALSELENMFQSLQKRKLSTLRLSLLADTVTLNELLSRLSRSKITLIEGENKVALLRIAISRNLTVYIIGIPIGLCIKTSQIQAVAPLLSSITVSLNNKVSNENLIELAKCKLEEFVPGRISVYDNDTYEIIKNNMELSNLGKLMNTVDKESSANFNEYICEKLSSTIVFR